MSSVTEKGFRYIGKFRVGPRIRCYSCSLPVYPFLARVFESEDYIYLHYCQMCMDLWFFKKAGDADVG
ncbi:MAG TPA: hypothetical protein DCR71_00020 [Dehalococcoidia bacterium]|nr:hypothetical protein [Dehalococcoidia bacterium]